MNPRIIEVFEYEDRSGVDCPFVYEVESTRARPEGCSHPDSPHNDCGRKDSYDVIPDDCPLRTAAALIRIKPKGTPSD